MYPGGNIIKVTPTIDTSAYGTNDLLFTKQELKNIVSSRGECSIIRNISIHTDIETDVDLGILIFDNDTAIGAAANEPMTNVSDDEFQAAGFIGGVSFDFAKQDLDVGNGRVYTSPGGQSQTSSAGLPLLVKTIGSGKSLWFVACTLAGEPTYDANSLSFTFNVEYLG